MTAVADLGSNLNEDEFVPPLAAQKSTGKGKAPAAAVAQRTRIVLEDNDQIGPSGQFFGADGKGYMLRPGEEADVPNSILNILDSAIMSVPVTDGSQSIIGYRDRLRFPYRVITARRGA